MSVNKKQLNNMSEQDGPIVINRNGVDLPLRDFEFVKGDRQGQKYPAPKIGDTEEDWNQIVKWYGVANLKNDLQTLLKRRFQTLYDDCINEEDGKFNKELFIKYASNLSSVGGLKMKEINIKLDELQAEAVALSELEDWDSPENMAKGRAINLEIKAYRQMRDDRSKKKKEDTDEQPSIAK